MTKSKCVPDNVVCGESLIKRETERAIAAMKEREVVAVVALAVVCSAASGN